jgi:hypothetical protein
MVATCVMLVMQLASALPAVMVMDATIFVEPESTVTKIFRFAPGDEILVTVEALKQELAESEKGDNTVGDAIVAGLSVLLTPKVGSVSLGPIDADPIAQAGDSQSVHLKCITTMGGPHWLAISGAHDGCRSTYRVTVKRKPARESLRSYDTRLVPAHIDTVADLFLEKEVYLAMGATQDVAFELPTGADRIALIVSNMESYNALTSKLGSSLLGFVTNMAFGIPLPIDLSSIRTGKDFGYSAEAYSGTLKQGVPLVPRTRTLFDKILINPSKRRYLACRIHLDNLDSKWGTSKTVKVTAYALTLKPVYYYAEPPAGPDAGAEAINEPQAAKNAGSSKYRVVVYANDEGVGRKVLDVVKVAGFARDESCVITGADGDAYIKYGAASEDDVRTMRKLVSRLYDGTLAALNEFDSDDDDVFINLP